jgi:hypothetical protein
MMTNTRHLRIAAWLIAFAAFLVLPLPVFAQTAVDHTTFSSAVDGDDTVVNLTAASGATAGGFLFVEGEKMPIQSVSGTAVTVRRGDGQGFTPARPHPTTAIVWVGSAEEFKVYNVAGSCTATTERYLPHINTKENRIFDCKQSLWIERNPARVNVHSAHIVCPNGQLACREEFNIGLPVMQDDGTAKSLADAEVNIVHGSAVGPITYREEQAKTVSSWVAIDGVLDISADNTTTAEGVEIIVGNGTDPTLNQTVEVGTNGACFAMMVTIADISAIDELVIGFRQNEAFADAVGYAGYGDWAVLGVVDTAGDIDAMDEEAGGGTQTDDIGVTWADGERRALKVCISSSGAPSFFYTDASPDREEPNYRQVSTTNTGDALTSGDGLVPFIAFLISGTDGPNVTIEWIELSYAP